MLLETNHIDVLLSFVRSISKLNDPDQLLSYNKVSALVTDNGISLAVDHCSVLRL